MLRKSWFVSLLLFVGLTAIYVGERILELGNSRLITSGLGSALVLAMVTVRALRIKNAAVDRKPVERALLGLAFIALAGVTLYFAQSDLLAKIDGRDLDATSPKLAGVIAALWPVLICVALFPLLLMELAYSSMSRGPIEGGRVRDAMLSGLGFAGVFVFAFSTMYVASERDTKWDLAYFRTAKPGEATLNNARFLENQVHVSLFFPPSNEVAELVMAYFNDLKKDAPRLEVTLYDQAVDRQEAQRLSVNANGVIVFEGPLDRREKLMMGGTELEKARGQLRNLDVEVQKRLLMVAGPSRVVYFTRGHGERTENPIADSQRSPIGKLMKKLKDQNYMLNPLGLNEGLTKEVPKDAKAVMIIGPTEPFLKEELETLKAYFKRGGKLMIALDPEARLDYRELLEPLNLSFETVMLANDVAFARVTHQISDRAIIGTTNYSSHPSVTTNGRFGYPMFLSGAGSFYQVLETPPAGMSIDFPVTAHPETFNDLNGNFTFDYPAPTDPKKPPPRDVKSEFRGTFNLAAAITQRPAAGSPKEAEEGRALLLSDSDAVSDGILENSKANGFFATEGFKWLLDEKATGVTNEEVDVPIERTRKQDVFWFYSTVFLAPGAVILAGLFAVRRSKMKPRPAAKGGGS